MRMSCNGCRVLRKGCSDACVIRPCLQWIRNPEAQANATVFLAKFYGRAGLINLIAAGPEHLRPAVFRSLLYEACGRMVNPVYGSVGLLWSGNWPLCQQAVEAVLKGSPITQLPATSAAATAVPPLKTCDIRHVSKNQEPSAEFHKLSVKSKPKFKRSAPTHNHSRSVQTPAGCCSGESGNDDSHVSVDTVADSHVSQGEPSGGNEGDEFCLDLTLGFSASARSTVHRTETEETEKGEADELRSDDDDETCRVELGLAIPVLSV
ncbi:hypothetical protein LUZ60_009896 [Juncus effusus]|nr:hypothetical protein LUZ60_009896 [Juncus effusus]